MFDYFKSRENKKGDSGTVRNSNGIQEYIDKLMELNNRMEEKDFRINSIQEDYKRIFNLFNESVVIIDKDGTIIDLNRTAQLEFLPTFNDSIIGKQWKDIIWTFGCSWDDSIEKKVIDGELLKELTKEIYVDILNKHMLISVIPVYKEDDLEYFLFIARDITKIKQRELALIKKQQLINAVDKITDVFTKNMNINFIMEQSLETLMRYLNDVDMCYIYKNCADIDGELYAEKIKECVSPVVDKTLLNVDKLYYKETFPRWLDFFKVNHIVCGHINSLPKNERQLLNEFGVKSICVVPIYTPIELWGFMGFDSTVVERNWTYDEEKILKIAAHVVGAGIYQWSLRNKDDELLTQTCITF